MIIEIVDIACLAIVGLLTAYLGVIIGTRMTEPSTKGSAEYFTGTVRIDPLFQAEDQRC